MTLYLIAPERNNLIEGTPYSLIYLAEWVRRSSDHEVKIVNSANEIFPSKNTYVGISVTTPTYQEGLKIAKRFEDCKIVLGGYHTKGQGKIILANHPEIDYVVEGEGEKAIVEILNGREKGVIIGEPLSSTEFNNISISDLLNFDNEYLRRSRQFGRMNYVSSKGCNYRCSFCASSGKLKTKSVNNIADDLERLVSVGEREISVQDNYFGYDQKRVRAVCEEIIRRNIDHDFDCQTRVESLQNIELLKLMRRAGCSAAWIGVENFYPNAIRKMKKSSNPEKYFALTKTVIENLVRVGIKPKLMFQVGLPNEESEAIEHNLRCLQELTGDLYLQLNVVYPGTPDYYKLVQEGVPADIFEKIISQNEKPLKFSVDDNFYHGNGSIPLGIVNLDKLKAGRIEFDEKKVKQVNDYVERIKSLENVRTVVPFRNN